MAMPDSLEKGVELVATVATVYIGVYALLMIGTLFLGVVANLVASGDVTVSGTYDQDNTSNNDGIGGAIYDVESSFNNTLDSITNPITIIASLIIVGVLVLMFPRFTGGSSSRGDVL